MGARPEWVLSGSRDAKLQTAISFGATLLGSVLGGKGVGRATTAARGVGRSMKQAGDVGRAEVALEEARRELAEMDARFREELATLEAALDPATVELQTREIRPTRAGVTVRTVALGWLPGRTGEPPPGPAWIPGP